MKKLIYIYIILITQNLTFNVCTSFAQTPYNTPDNIGPGNCLSFDASGELLYVPNDFNLAANFTIEGWLQINASDEGFFFHIPYTNDNNTSIDMYVAGGKLIARNAYPSAPLTSAPTSTTTVTDGQWHHFAVTYDGTNHNLYINGVMESSIVRVGSVRQTSLNKTAIGSIFLVTGSNSLNCQMDDVRIWNLVRTPTQIKAGMCKELTGGETGLLGYWNMNEGSGGTVADLSGNGNNGTRQ